MKKLINNVNDILDEMLNGIEKAHPELKRVKGYNIITRKEINTKKVNLVSGGGSGHEPSHAGFVGYGMLDAAVAGEVFTSPTPDQVYEAVKEVESEKGVLLIIKNYTGDIMNFQMAEDMGKSEGINVESVIVNDDVAVENSTYTVGRRGIAGTIFVHKIAGAAAESGKDLGEVKLLAEKVIENVKSMGMSLGPCTVPASGKASFELGEDEVELGLGIHGEPGVQKEKIKTANEHVKDILDKILENIDLEKESEVAVLVNGLGATPLMELYIINNSVNDYLKDKNIKIHKTLVGNYMTSLEMPGFSISLLKLDDEMKKYLDEKSITPAFR